MRPQFRRLVATFLLAGFSVFLIPKECVHALYGHKDTREQIAVNGKTSIGAHHMHCGFLSFEASLFTLTPSAKTPVSTDHAFAYAMVETENDGIVFADFPSLRGPPIV